MNRASLKIKYLMFGAIVAILLFNAASLGFSPPPTDFEAWMIEPGWVFFHGGGLTSKIFDNILEARNGSLGQGNALHFLFGAATTLFGHQVVSARAVTFICGIILIAALYRLASRIAGTYAALFSVITLISTSAFFYSTHLSRASIFVGTLHFIAFICLWRYRDAKNEVSCGACAAGAALAAFSTVLFHFSGAIVACAITGTFLVMAWQRRSIRSAYFFFAGALVVVVAWYLMHVFPMGTPLFMEKMALAHGAIAREWRLARLVVWHYFFISQFNYFFLIAFIASVSLIMMTRDRLGFAVLYLGFYVLISVIVGNEDPEPHKAIIFMPLVSLPVGVMISKSRALWSEAGRPVAKIAVALLILSASLAVVTGLAKQAVYVMQARSVRYDTYLAEVKRIVPPHAAVLGQPHLWFSLEGRNQLFGGTFFLGRAAHYMKGFTRCRTDAGQPVLTLVESKEILAFIKTKGISFIVASEDMYEWLGLNGLFRDELKGRLVEVKRIFTPFYGRESFRPGYVRIYQVQFS